MSDPIRMPYHDGEIEVQVKYSGRRTLAIEMSPGPQVLVRAPYRYPKWKIRRILEEQWDMITKRCEQVDAREQNRQHTGAPPMETLTSVQRRQIRDTLVSRVEYYARLMDVQVERVTIRNQKKRWGSCGGGRRINLNYQLYYLPDALRDYVVIHELAHCRHMNHSKEFWQEVEKYCPDYRIRNEKLDREYRI